MTDSRKGPTRAKEDLISLLCGTAEAHVLKKAVFSKPADAGVVRAVLTSRVIGGRECFQLEVFQSDNKAVHRNFAWDDPMLAETVRGYGQINLFTTAGDCEYRCSKSGNAALLGAGKIQAALRSGTAMPAVSLTNNREKRYILNGSEPFLHLLGVSDANGRVYDKMQSKFRQINRFLELTRDIVDRLPDTGTLRIADLCCGKSYLSFAVYHYFTEMLGRSVKMTGVDLKPDVMRYCADVAKRLHFDGLEFLCGDVGKYESAEHVHLVVSLHACDIATDLVLERAMHWQSEVILSTPCCHHELNHTLCCPTLSFIAEHSMLRQKFCDAATDALRLKLLESRGYDVCALELIDPEETPKNILLRAVRKKRFDPESADAKHLAEEYEDAKKFLLGTKIHV